MKRVVLKILDLYVDPNVDERIRGQLGDRFVNTFYDWIDTHPKDRRKLLEERGQEIVNFTDQVFQQRPKQRGVSFECPIHAVAECFKPALDAYIAQAYVGYCTKIDWPFVRIIPKGWKPGR